MKKRLILAIGIVAMLLVSINMATESISKRVSENEKDLNKTIHIKQLETTFISSMKKKDQKTEPSDPKITTCSGN